MRLDEYHRCFGEYLDLTKHNSSRFKRSRAQRKIATWPEDLHKFLQIRMKVYARRKRG